MAGSLSGAWMLWVFLNSSGWEAAAQARARDTALDSACQAPGLVAMTKASSLLLVFLLPIRGLRRGWKQVSYCGHSSRSAENPGHSLTGVNKAKQEWTSLFPQRSPGAICPTPRGPPLCTPSGWAWPCS